MAGTIHYKFASAGAYSKLTFEGARPRPPAPPPRRPAALEGARSRG